MKWLKALKVGYAVLKVAEAAGVSIKGVPLSTIDQVAIQVVQDIRTSKATKPDSTR